MIYVSELIGLKRERRAVMWTDGTENELHYFAELIGLRRKPVQCDARGWHGSYELAPNKWRTAQQRGAQVMPLREAAWVNRI